MTAVQPAGAQVPRALGISHGDDRHQAVCRFLSFEARLLNNNELRAWLALLDESFRYLVPVRTNRLPADGPGFEASVHVDDDYPAVAGKVRRAVETVSAWAEQPQSRTRRLVTNTEVFATGDPEVLEAISSVLIQRNRGNGNQVDHISAERHDRLRVAAGEARLLARTVYLDHALLGTPNLGIFL
jgi:3-phenylpropionate/cinnamic acid dioxygenase small subunit